MDKKGNILDWFYIMIILFILGIMLLAGFMIVQQTQDSGLFDDYERAEENINNTRAALLSFDNIMLIIIIGTSLAVIVSSALVWNHPAFFFLSIILLLIAITVAGILSNTWFDFYNHPQIIDYAAHYQKTQFILNKLPFYIGLLGMIALIVSMISYTKQQ